MKKFVFLMVLSLVIGLTLYIIEGKAQMGPGMMGGWVTVADKLPTPKNVEWVQKLREILVLEKKSYDQYIIDAEKYNAAMPYMMVIPQEEDHVNLIERLFLAYGSGGECY